MNRCIDESMHRNWQMNRDPASFYLCFDVWVYKSRSCPIPSHTFMMVRKLWLIIDSQKSNTGACPAPVQVNQCSSISAFTYYLYLPNIVNWYQVVHYLYNIFSFQLPKGNNATKIANVRRTCYAMEIWKNAGKEILEIKPTFAPLVIYVKRGRVTAINTKSVRVPCYAGHLASLITRCVNLLIQPTSTTGIAAFHQMQRLVSPEWMSHAKLMNIANLAWNVILITDIMTNQIRTCAKLDYQNMN